MYRPLHCFLGLRHVRSHRGRGFISFIALSSLAGIALGVAALIAVLSVMNGFEREVRERLLGMVAHGTLTGPGGVLESWERLAPVVGRHPGVAAVAPYVAGEALMSRRARVSGVQLRGVLPGAEAAVSSLAASMVAGRLEDLAPGRRGIVLGEELAAFLDLAPGDTVTLIATAQGLAPGRALPELERFTVTGVFSVGVYELDRSSALLHLEDAAKLFGLSPAVSGLRLKLDDPFRAPEVVPALARGLDVLVHASDWTRDHGGYFAALAGQKRMLFLVLALIVAVAAFNLVSALVMVVVDKEGDIAILRTLGMSPAGVLAVFLVQGAAIAVGGVALGTVGGVALALNLETLIPALETVFGVRFISAEVYLIDEIPSQLNWADVGSVALVALLLSLLAAVYPALRAAAAAPAEALRYE